MAAIASSGFLDDAHHTQSAPSPSLSFFSYHPFDHASPDQSPKSAWDTVASPSLQATLLPSVPSTASSSEGGQDAPPPSYLTVGHLLNAVPDFPLPKTSGISGVLPPMRSTKGMPFVRKLRALLGEPEKYRDCLCWDQEGTSFIVSTKTERLLREVLPKSFGHSNISSFNRQLNVYGFHRMPLQTLLEKLDIESEQGGTNIGFSGWSHPDFTRDGKGWVGMTPRPSRARQEKKAHKERARETDRGKA